MLAIYKTENSEYTFSKRNGKFGRVGHLCIDYLDNYRNSPFRNGFATLKTGEQLTAEQIINHANFEACTFDCITFLEIIEIIHIYDNYRVGLSAMNQLNKSMHQMAVQYGEAEPNEEEEESYNSLACSANFALSFFVKYVWKLVCDCEENGEFFDVKNTSVTERIILLHKYNLFDQNLIRATITQIMFAMVSDEQWQHCYANYKCTGYLSTSKASEKDSKLSKDFFRKILKRSNVDKINNEIENLNFDFAVLVEKPEFNIVDED